MTTDSCDVGQMKQIDILPDEVLLEIFDFYMITHPLDDDISSDECKKTVEAWQLLIHVCRRWRSLVLGSPRRLNLRLYCTYKTPIRDILDVWPALPLLICGGMTLSPGTDNIIAALGQSNRVCQVFLWNIASACMQLERVFAAMQVPFPELTDLRLSSFGMRTPAIPDSFLDGSAPRLRSFELHGIHFPGLPKLLLSATHLVSLSLSNIPDSGYISPEAMAALLSMLSSLRSLILHFRPPQSLPGWESQSLPPPKRSILPALDLFYFEGVTAYLEGLVTFIDAPQLKTLNITFVNQIDFVCPQLAQFINCTPTLRERDEAHVQFDDSGAVVKLRYRTSKTNLHDLLIYIPCRVPDLQLSSIGQACNSSFHPISTVKDLYIEHQCRLQDWKNAIENGLWLELLLPFTAVKNLYLSNEFAPGIAAALQGLVEGRITEVLPSLQNIFVEGPEPSGPFQESIGQFVAARQLSCHPIAISGSDTRPM